jgi:hypothetical protein
VAVQATAFMTFRDVRQVVGGFEGEIFKQRGGHLLLSIGRKNRRRVPESTFFRIN